MTEQSVVTTLLHLSISHYFSSHKGGFWHNLFNIIILVNTPCLCTQRERNSLSLKLLPKYSLTHPHRAFCLLEVGFVCDVYLLKSKPYFHFILRISTFFKSNNNNKKLPFLSFFCLVFFLPMTRVLCCTHRTEDNHQNQRKEKRKRHSASGYHFPPELREIAAGMKVCLYLLVLMGGSLKRKPDGRSSNCRCNGWEDGICLSTALSTLWLVHILQRFLNHASYFSADFYNSMYQTVNI